MSSKVLVVMIATVVFARTADADIILPLDLQPGDQYQLIFVTTGTRDATSGKAADYNQFVTAQAAQDEDNDRDTPQKRDDSADARQQLAMTQWREAKRRVRQSQ